jgi:hypothetical protein
MKHPPQDHLLHTLHSQLQHFDHSPDFGDAAADVNVIERLPALRIREAESALRRNQRLQTEAA